MSHLEDRRGIGGNGSGSSANPPRRSDMSGRHQPDRHGADLCEQGDGDVSNEVMECPNCAGFVITEEVWRQTWATCTRDCGWWSKLDSGSSANQATESAFS